MSICTTPDPFAGLGGGTCYNGGWLPPGMTPPVLEIVIDVTTAGTLRRDAGTGEWFIEGDDGELYQSTTDIPDGLLTEGRRVTLQGAIVSAPTPEIPYTVLDIQTLVIIM